MFKKERSDSSFDEKLKALESERKLIELDLEKRMIVLERDFEKIKASLKNIDDIGEIDALIKSSKDIQNRLRELEDMKYLEKMELISSFDEIGALKQEIELLKKKEALIEEAIENLGDVAVSKNSKDLNSSAKEIGTQLDELKSKIDSLSEKKLDKNDFDEYKKEFDAVKSSVNSLQKDIADIVDNVIKEIDVQRKRIDLAISEASRISELENKIEGSYKDISYTKDLVKKNQEFVESLRKRVLDTQKLIEAEIKSIQSDVDNKIKNEKEREKKIDDIRKELHDEFDSHKKFVDSRFSELSDVDKSNISKELKDYKKLLSELRELKELGNLDSRMIKEAEKLKNLFSELKEVKNMDSYIEKKIKDYVTLNSLNSRFKEIEKSLSKNYSTKEEFKNIIKIIDTLSDKFEKHKEEVLKSIKSEDSSTSRKILSELDKQKKTIERLQRVNIAEKQFNKKLEEIEKRLVDALMKIPKGKKTITDRDILVKLSLLESRIDDIFSKHAKTYSKSNSLEDDIINLESKLDGLSEDNSFLKEEIKKLEESFKNAIIDNKKETHKTIELKVKGSSRELEDKIDELNNELQIIKDFRDDIINDVTNMINQALKGNRDVEKLKSFEEFESSKIDSIDEKLSQRIAKIESKIERLLSSETKGFKSLEHENETLRNELEKVKNAYFNDSKSDIEEKIDMILKENKKLKNELEELKRAYVRIMNYEKTAPMILD